jgi:hypothetical protein
MSGISASLHAEHDLAQVSVVKLHTGATGLLLHIICRGSPDLKQSFSFVYMGVSNTRTHLESFDAHGGDKRVD